MLAKALYAAEWAASLVESHPASAARDQVVGKHHHDVAVIEESLLQKELAQLAEEHPQTMEAATAEPVRVGATFDPGCATAAGGELPLRWL